MEYKLLAVCDSDVSASVLAIAWCRRRLREKGLEVDIRIAACRDAKEKLELFQPQAILLMAAVPHGAFGDIKCFAALSMLCGTGAAGLVKDIAGYLIGTRKMEQTSRN